ncbi:unnamed protein product [Pleuronectes platessa]|uniref:Uncharacterized protein n=1 Tax=Pleuronectes platessa TaxID=8262 RepID=A0A9N7TX86_PLEPL|nr:unnamed protein product [Pleuronectes platessa]
MSAQLTTTHLWNGKTAGHVPRLGEQSLRRPPLRRRRLSVRHREVLIRWHLTASLVRGAFFLLDRGAVSIAVAEGGPLEGTGYAVSGGHSGRVSGPSRGSPQLRRPLGEPSGWRLAAD